MAIQMSDPAKAQRMNIAVNIWTARTIPVILAGIVGYATYVFVVVLCGLSSSSYPVYSFTNVDLSALSSRQTQ